MRRRRLHGCVALLVTASATGCTHSRVSGPHTSANEAATSTCLVGAYRAANGEIVTLTKSSAETGALRFVRPDGATGVFRIVVRPPSGSFEMTAGPGYSDSAPVVAWLRHGACEDPELHLRFGGESERVWKRLALRIHPTHFESDGVALAGQWIEPEQTASDAPIVVYVHGSEHTGMIDAYALPFLLASQGIAAFVYDKRGTGQSAGSYTQNFTRLAKDARSAVDEARRMSAGRYPRVGLLGGSQGGWVAPLAARMGGADFVVVTFGIVATPLEEDAQQVADELTRKGYGAEVLEKAHEVTDAAGAIVASHFTSGFEELANVKRRFGGEPWFKELRGEYSGDMLRETDNALRTSGRAKYDDLDIEWHYDSRAVLEALTIPELWVLAGDDTEAPSSTTMERLKTLQAEGKPIDLAVFPHADHGITEFAVLPDGTRKTTRYATGYYALIIDWLRRAIRPPYGSSTLSLHRGS